MQLSNNDKKNTVYALTELPVYRFRNGVHVASQIQVTTGIAYRFMTSKKVVCLPED